MRLALPKESPAAVHIGIALVVGVVVGLVVASTDQRPLIPILAGWAATAVTFVISALRTTWPMDAETTATHATREEPTRRVAHAIVLSASLVSLAGVITVIATTQDDQRVAGVAVCIVVALSSWAAIHTLYGLRYARIYYTGPDGGIDFHQTEPPQYSDFYYTAFAVGMSYAISDTDLASTPIRRVALGHGLLAYLFGAVILASLVNLLAGL